MPWSALFLPASRPGEPVDAEVANYVDAVNHGVALLEQLPLCLRLVRELHEKLLTGVRGAEETPGQVRRVQNFIGRSDIASARLVPPPPPEQLEPLLADFEQYLNLADSDDGVPLLVRMAIPHYQFETLHPFRDRKGRVWRLLIPRTLLAHVRMTTSTLYVSGYLEQQERRHVGLMLEASRTGEFAVRNVEVHNIESTRSPEVRLADLQAFWRQRRGACEALERQGRPLRALLEHVVQLPQTPTAFAACP